jgi:hypothetical protein
MRNRQPDPDRGRNEPAPRQPDPHEVICERYVKAPTILTSNRDFNEWPMVFHNPIMGSAAMDRLVHRATKNAIEAKSYRVDAFVRRSRNLPMGLRVAVSGCSPRAPAVA